MGGLDFGHEASLEELRTALRRALREGAAAQARTSQLVDAVYSAAHAAALSSPAKPIKPPKADRRKVTEEIALVHATDWQYGKETETFNPDSCRRRIMRFANRVERLTDLHRSAIPVRRATVLLGGDMVEGVNIFPGQSWEVRADLYTQLFGVVDLIEEFLIALLVVFEHVDVWCEWGNHGRLGRKGEYKASDNIDRIAYGIVRDRFAVRGESRIDIHSSDNWHQIVPIGDYTALLIHGDEIKQFGGNLPAYGIVRKMTAWASGAIAQHFDDGYFGHYHTPMSLVLPNGRRIFGTGSPESDNIYAQEFVAATGYPSQRLHFIHPTKRRVTAEHVVYLDE